MSQSVQALRAVGLVADVLGDRAFPDCLRIRYTEAVGDGPAGTVGIIRRKGNVPIERSGKVFLATVGTLLDWFE